MTTESLFYDKWVMTADGKRYMTDMPLDCIYPDGWRCITFRGHTFIAFSVMAGQAPYNAFFDTLRAPTRHPRLRGDVTVFRRHSHILPRHVNPNPPARLEITREQLLANQK